MKIGYPKKSEKKYDDFFSYLGKLSYPLYLIHLNVGMVIFNLLYKYVNWYLLVGLTCILMILIAHLINAYIEKPFSKYLKNKLSPWAHKQVIDKETTPLKVQ